MLTETELIADIACECLAVSNDSGYLTNLLIETCEHNTAEELKTALLEAKAEALLILSTINNSLSRINSLFVERTPCDQLGNGCTCEECTSQIADACGIIYDCTPVDLDSPEYDDDDCEKVEPTVSPRFASIRSRVEHKIHRMGYRMDINTVPDRLWDLWLCQGQSLQQMANLCHEFDKSPATF